MRFLYDKIFPSHRLRTKIVCPIHIERKNDLALDTTDKILRFRNEFQSRGKPSEVEWRFYYDETNNFRRLRFGKAVKKSADGNHNVSDSLEKSFILGGVAFASEEAEEAIRQDFDAQQFPTSLDRQSGKRETKCKQICIGHNIIQILNNTRVGRVRDFLRLLDRDDVYVHIHSSNAFFYYVVSEIVQKLTWILGIDDKGIDYSSHFLEDMLYDIVREDKAWFMETLKHWGYPSMDRTPDIREFCDVLDKYVESAEDLTFCGYSIKCDRMRWYELGRMLRHVAKKCILIRESSDERLRIGLGDDCIVDSLCDFYWAPCLVWYPFSHHVFDEEEIVKEKLESLLPEGIIANSEMRNSVDDTLIQVSDIWVGLYAKYEELLDGYVAKTILPNYSVNPRHISMEDATKEIVTRIEAEKEWLDVLRVTGNRITYNVTLKGLQNKLKREYDAIVRELSFPNTDEATKNAADAILKQLNETGKENIRLISRLIIKSVDADKYMYRIEDSETTYRLRMDLMKTLAAS